MIKKKSNDRSYQLGFRDGQECGDNMVKTYNIKELLEKLSNPGLNHSDIYYKEFIKNEEEIRKSGYDYDRYREGFIEGCRDIITVGNEQRELGVAD